MRLSGRIERRGVELHELHVLNRSLGAIDHRLAVARGNDRIGRCLIDSSATSRTHQCDLGQIGVNRLFGIQHVCTVALDVRGAASDAHAHVVLSDDFHSEVILLHSDIGTGAHSSHQSALNLGARIVGMVKNAELRVAAFAMQVESAIVLAVEVDSPLHQLLYLFRRFAHHLFHCSAIRDVVACNHGVLNMFLEIIDGQIRYRGYAALCK